MSLQTWMEEFYPISSTDTPIEFKGNTKVLSFKDHLDIYAISLAEKKWSGLSPENLAKHDVHLIATYVVPLSVKTVEEIELLEKDQVFIVGISTCALCALYHLPPTPCISCPIMQKNGFTCIPAYIRSIEEGNPEHMLKILAETKEWVIEQ